MRPDVVLLLGELTVSSGWMVGRGTQLGVYLTNPYVTEVLDDRELSLLRALASTLTTTGNTLEAVLQGISKRFLKDLGGEHGKR